MRTRTVLMTLVVVVKGDGPPAFVMETRGAFEDMLKGQDKLAVRAAVKRLVEAVGCASMRQMGFKEVGPGDWVETEGE